MTDSEWCFKFPSTGVEKELNFIPLQKMKEFNNSTYLSNLFEGAENQKENDGTKPYLPNTKNNAISLRNALITRCCTALARRAQEFSTLTLKELLNPVDIRDDCTVVRAFRHKTWENQLCYIAFPDNLYEIALIYTKYYRVALIDDISENSPAFPSTLRNKKLTVSAIGTITDKTFKRAGIKTRGRVCPRRIRISYVKTLAAAGCSAAEMEDLSFAMSHSRRTAIRNYTV